MQLMQKNKKNDNSKKKKEQMRYICIGNTGTTNYLILFALFYFIYLLFFYACVRSYNTKMQNVVEATFIKQSKIFSTQVFLIPKF